MADQVEQRPSDNFKTAITEPSYFAGRNDLLAKIRHSPNIVRILLGGRRLGKTSTLRAVEWNLLELEGGTSQAFPVLINLDVEQPRDLDNFRYLLIARSNEAFERWKQVPGLAIREKYRQFRRQVKGGEVTVSFLQQLNIKLNVDNPDSERRLIHEDFQTALINIIERFQKHHYQGVCFLLDGAEFVVRQPWANDAWGYFRGLKDTNDALKPFLGLLLSGYRELKEYQQAVGSALYNISDKEWLSALSIPESSQLINHRMRCEQITLPNEVVAVIQRWAGCHPYLTQQMLNMIFDSHPEKKGLKMQSLISRLTSQYNQDFSVWWNSEAHQTGGFGESERLIYKTLVRKRSATAESLTRIVDLSEIDVKDSLEILAGTGVIWQNGEQYEIGAKLFEQWVMQQRNS
jgi:hypothetical protein